MIIILRNSDFNINLYATMWESNVIILYLFQKIKKHWPISIINFYLFLTQYHWTLTWQISASNFFHSGRIQYCHKWREVFSEWRDFCLLSILTSYLNFRFSSDRCVVQINFMLKILSIEYSICQTKPMKIESIIRTQIKSKMTISLPHFWPSK